MKLLLFALFCIVTLLIIRSVQSGGRSAQGGGSHPPASRKGTERGAPPVPPDDIVDVPFKDVEDGGRKPPEGS